MVEQIYKLYFTLQNIHTIILLPLAMTLPKLNLKKAMRISPLFTKLNKNQPILFMIY
jgi:hypothetical protein